MSIVKLITGCVIIVFQLKQVHCTWVGLERNQRVCNLCNNGDKYCGRVPLHIYRCSYFSVKSKHYIVFSNLMDANTLDFASIMCEQDINILTKLCMFVNIVMQHVRRPPG